MLRHNYKKCILIKKYIFKNVYKLNRKRLTVLPGMIYETVRVNITT